MIPGLLNTTATVKRRASTGRDSLNNPTYGAPTSGSGWSTVYTNMPIRMAFSSKTLEFAQTGERPNPAGVAYITADYQVQSEDRIITSDSIEYVVTSVVIGYSVAAVVDHYELVLALP